MNFEFPYRRQGLHIGMPRVAWPRPEFSHHSNSISYLSTIAELHACINENAGLTDSPDRHNLLGRQLYCLPQQRIPMTMAFGRQLDCYMWASEGGTGQFLPVPEKDLFFLKKNKNYSYTYGTHPGDFLSPTINNNQRFGTGREAHTLYIYIYLCMYIRCVKIRGRRAQGPL